MPIDIFGVFSIAEEYGAKTKVGNFLDRLRFWTNLGHSDDGCRLGHCSEIGLNFPENDTSTIYYAIIPYSSKGHPNVRTTFFKVDI